jgi:hypothetical protein
MGAPLFLGDRVMTLIPVAANATALDVLAQRYRAALNKINGGREQWIEGTLELAVVMADARIELPSNQAFSLWLQRYQLGHLSPNDRTALVGFSQDLEAARKMLEQATGSTSWRTIWEKRPKAAVIKVDKSRPSLRNRRNASGWSKQKRIPDVMRDDADQPPPRPERKGVILKALTPEQVDPDFKGTSLEFATKYGHVNLHTKQEIEHHKRQDALSAWLGAVSEFESAGRAMVAAYAAVNPATLQEWTAKPGKAVRLRTWIESIKANCDRLHELIAQLTPKA